MPTIIKGQNSKAVAQVRLDGKNMQLTGSITVGVTSMDGTVIYVSARVAPSDVAGSDWPSGVVAVDFTSGETAAMQAGDAIMVLLGDFGLRRFHLLVETLELGTRTSLFVRDIAVEEIRRDRLMAATAGILQDVKVSDDYIWEKVRAAESDLSSILRVPLVPTRFFPIQPTSTEIASLGTMAWAIDDGYDYEPNMFERDKWGYIVTRQRPIISVQYMRFAYPTQNEGFFDVPLDWLRVDARPGDIRIVPSSSAVLMGTAGFAMTTLINRRNIPAMVQISYTAGLTNAAANYPELLDVIKKKAVLKIVADAFLPQSGSISADGLSQSMSVDLSKYSDSIDEIINGPKGSNGGLMTKIHGLRMMVM